MKAIDLMVGDWIADKQGNRMRVVNILSEAIEDYYYGIETDKGSVEFEDAQPIPLTEEILRKNGWEEILKESESVAAKFGRKPEGSGAWELYTKGMSVYVTPGLRYLPWVRIKGPAGQYDFNIRYVHELQHILRICHIDKEITI